MKSVCFRRPDRVFNAAKSMTEKRGEKPPIYCLVEHYIMVHNLQPRVKSNTKSRRRRRPIAPVRPCSSVPQTLPPLLECDNFAIMSCSSTAPAQFFQIFCFQKSPPVVFYDALQIGQVEPGEYGPDGRHGAKQQENEALSCVALVCRVDAVND